MRRRFLIAALVFAAGFGLWAQEREDRALLPWDQMRAIINEASGERALQTTLELVPYPRVRPRAEYEGQFRESEIMARRAREYGLSNVVVESFPAQQSSWRAAEAELWITSPQRRKLYDVHEVAVSVAGGSESGEVEAVLVDVGSGRAASFAGKDVAGKIVLGSASAGQLQQQAIFERGALGVLSYASVHADDTDQVLAQGISGRAPQGRRIGFGWSISPRVGRELAARLARGENITLRSMIQSETFPGEMETVHAEIPGDGSSDQAVMISAHLYEGYIKQGANDDASGCAATLEMGRTYQRLISQGLLPKPRRTIHFLWVPEISGTTAWLRKHADIKSRLIADLNFDMEGLSLRAAGAEWVMHRTPDTFPSFINDVGANLMEVIGETNRERVRYRANGYGFTLPVFSPNGTRDPFYVRVEKHYGSSDHVVYLNEGIPAVIFVTWPDPWYHSSQDTPDKLDSTQFKRVAVIGTAAIAVLAGGDEMAARVTAEAMARGTERMGAAQRKGLSYLADVRDAAALADALQDAIITVQHQARVEKDVVKSAAVLFSDRAAAEQRLAPLIAAVAERGAALEREAAAFHRLQAEMRGEVRGPAAGVSVPAPSPAREEAARTRAERAGTPGAGGLAAQAALARQPADARAKLTAALAKVPQHMTTELSILLRRNMTVLEIRDFLSGEFEPLSLDDLWGWLRAQEQLGLAKLTAVPPPAPPAPVKARPARKR